VKSTQKPGALLRAFSIYICQTKSRFARFFFAQHKYEILLLRSALRVRYPIPIFIDSMDIAHVRLQRQTN
ncbi:hypothetical protein ACOIXN_004589, partial [Vibrio vulnificus]